MLYVKTLLVAVSWRDKYTEAMSAHGYEEGATRSRKRAFLCQQKVSLGLAILIIIFLQICLFFSNVKEKPMTFTEQAKEQAQASWQGSFQHPFYHRVT